MNAAREPSSGPGATAVRSAWTRMWSTGAGRCGDMAAATSSRGGWVWLLDGMPGSVAVALPRRVRAGDERAPRPVTPSHSASRRTPSMAPSSRVAVRRGRRQWSRSRIEVPSAAIPGSREASSTSTSLRIPRIAGHWTPGPRAFAGVSPTRLPTRWGARVEASHALASTAQRWPAALADHSSSSGVGAQTGTISPSSPTSPAAYDTSTTKAARSGSTSSTRPATLRSRTDRPPARSTRGGSAPHAAHSSSTRDRRSLAAPPATASTTRAETSRAVISGARSRTLRCRRPPRRTSPVSRGRATRSLPTGTSRFRSRSQRTAVVPAGPVGRTPVAGPHVSRSRTVRAPSGATSRAPRTCASVGTGAPGRRSRYDGPSPATDGPSTSGTVRTTWVPSLPRHRRARAHRSSTRERTVGASASLTPSSPSTGCRSSDRVGSAATTSASSTRRWPSSNASIARWTLARVEARAARLVRSAGAGLARSGRDSTSVASSRSSRPRMSSARLRPVAGSRLLMATHPT